MTSKINRIRQLINIIFTKEQLRSLLLLEIIAGILYSITSLVFFVFITNAVLQQQTLIIDDFISKQIFSLRNPALTTLMLFISFMGSQAIMAGAAIIVILLTLRKHRKETFIFSVLLLMGALASFSLKYLYKVPRPIFSVLINEKSYSYPSGHALNSLLFYATITYFIYHFTKNKKVSVLVGVLSTVLIFLIGFSRIYLGVHHPSDVVSGYIFGFLLFVVTILVDKTITFFRLIRESSSNTE